MDIVTGHYFLNELILQLLTVTYLSASCLVPHKALTEISIDLCPQPQPSPESAQDLLPLSFSTVLLRVGWPWVFLSFFCLNVSR